jgi:hypothetical protein
METHDAANLVCRQCDAVLDVGDCFCRHCGTSTAPATELVEAVAASAPSRPPLVVQPASRRSPWAESVLVVLTMLFVVLGPLALPMLWRSRQFSLLWKVLLTVVVLGVTVLVVWAIWYVFNQMLAPLLGQPLSL